MAQPIFETRYSGPGVYIIRCGDLDFYKIGATALSFKQRLKDMQSGCPFLLTLVMFIRTPNRDLAFTLEGKLHERFRNKRIRREWFELSEEDINTIV
jgi:hypothetical protein